MNIRNNLRTGIETTFGEIKMQNMEIDSPKVKKHRNTSIQELPIYVPLNYHVIVRQPSRQIQQRRQYKQFILVCLGLSALVLFFGAPFQIIKSILKSNYITKDQDAWSLNWGGSVLQWGNSSNQTLIDDENSIDLDSDEFEANSTYFSDLEETYGALYPDSFILLENVDLEDDDAS